MAVQRALGVTGGIGCGKSEVARLLRAQGVPVLDTDDVAHDVLLAGTQVHRAVVERFGAAVLGADGEIDRARLGAAVFGDAGARETLNRIVHPVVMRETEAWLAARAPGAASAVVVPLLYEVGWLAPWRKIVCVAASEDVARQRLRARGWSDEEIDRRRGAQWPVEDKVRKADYVIWNEGSLAALADEVSRVWRQFSERSE